MDHEIGRGTFERAGSRARVIQLRVLQVQVREENLPSSPDAGRGDDLHRGDPASPRRRGPEMPVPPITTTRMVLPVKAGPNSNASDSPFCCRLRAAHRRPRDKPTLAILARRSGAEKAPVKIPKRLEPLVEAGLVDAVMRQLMSGKEA